MTADLSVVVATRDRPEMLDRALASLRASLRPTDELLVVDSASRDAAAVRAVVDRYAARLVRCEQPGEARARNRGWRAASHSLVGYVDDDVWVAPGWADAMRQAADSAPTVAFVTGRIDIPEGQGTLAVSIKADQSEQVFDRNAHGVIGHAANLVVRREAVASVGGFDEMLGVGARFHAAPETDLFDRLFAVGATGCYAPAAQAWHDQWRRAREYVRLQHRYGIGAGARLSKLWRLDRGRWRIVVVDDVWRWGVRSLVGELWRRDWPRAAGSLLRVLGMLRGFVAAARVPLRAGHFAASSSS